MTVGELVAYLRLDKKDWDTKLKTADKSLDKFGKTADKAFKTVAKVAKWAFVAASVAIVKGVKDAVAFERQMANISTMLGTKTLPMMKDFSRGILDLSTKFGGSTDKLTKGLYDILSASVPAEKAMGVLETSLKAAKAGLSDTGVAADVLTTLLNSFGDTADNVDYYADILFTTVKRGKTTFDELAGSIGNVAPIAAAASVGVEEMAAMLAIMTRNGIDTATAATNLKGAITSMLKPTDEAVDLAKELGIEFGASALEAKGLEGVMDDLADLPPDILVRLFPNVRGLMAVVSSAKEMKTEMAAITGIMEEGSPMMEAFNKQTETMGFAWDQAKATLKAVGIEIGTSLMPTIRDVVSAIKEWVTQNKEGIVKSVESVVEIVKTSLGFIAQFRDVIFGFGAALGALMIAKKAAMAITAFSTAAKLASGPVGWITAGVTALVGGFLMLRRRVAEMREENELYASGLEGTLATSQEYNKVLEIHKNKTAAVTKAYEDEAELIGIVTAAAEAKDQVTLNSVIGSGRLLDIGIKYNVEIAKEKILTDNLNAAIAEENAQREADAKLIAEAIKEQGEFVGGIIDETQARYANRDAIDEEGEAIDEEREAYEKWLETYRQGQAEEDALRAATEEAVAAIIERIRESAEQLRDEFAGIQEETTEDLLAEIETRKDAFIAAGVDVAKAEEWAAAETVRINKDAADKTEKAWRTAYAKVESAITTVVGKMKDVFSSFFDWQASMIDANMTADINAAREAFESDEDFLAEKERIQKEYAKKEYDLKKAQFIVDKVASLVQIAIDTVSAAITAWSAGPIIGPIMAAIITGLGITAAAFVAAKTYPPMPAYDKGGWVGGAPGVDMNMIRASKGEYVVDRENASRNAGLLEGMSAGTSVDITPGQAVVELDGRVMAVAMIPYLEEEADRGNFRVHPRAMREP